MKKIFLISCMTGCTCCSDDNHIRGPFKSKEDAERRISYYKSPESKFWPLASQFAKRGRYEIKEYDCEEISGNRFIIEDRVFYDLTFIDVNEDGTIENDSEEYFCSDL